MFFLVIFLIISVFTTMPLGINKVHEDACKVITSELQKEMELEDYALEYEFLYHSWKHPPYSQVKYDGKTSLYTLEINIPWFATLEKHEQRFALAHELAHIKKNHNLQSSIGYIGLQAFGTGLLVYDSISTGCKNFASYAAACAVGILAYKWWMRLQEYEADNIGAQFAGVLAAQGVLKKIGTTEAQGSWLQRVNNFCSSLWAEHPQIEDRIHYVQV